MLFCHQKIRGAAAAVLFFAGLYLWGLAFRLGENGRGAAICQKVKIHALGGLALLSGRIYIPYTAGSLLSERGSDAAPLLSPERTDVCVCICI